MLQSVLLAITGVLGVLLTVMYAYQVVYLFVPLILKRKNKEKPVKQHRYAILIAARNEEKVIGNLLDNIQRQDYPAELFTAFVVADNCTDATAQIAESHGATVFCRFNKRQVGKGYALEYLLERIEETVGLDTFDAFLVFDADNVLMPDYLTQINKTCDAGYDAFTGYRNSKNFGDNWLSAGHAMWYLHDSVHLNLSRQLLGVSCVVNGTGFGFTRELLRKCGGWHFFTLTEDIEFSTWCVTHGVRTGYCHDAMLFDEQPNKLKVSWNQRTRWAQGGFQIAFRYLKEYRKGLLAGGRTTYSTLEMLTLSLYGYGLAAVAGVLSVVSVLLSGDPVTIGIAAASAVAGSYVSMFFMGALTLLTEWKKIRAGTKGKILGLFTFPLYMLTFLPISFCAMFRKFEWTPIAHTVAVTAGDLNKE